MIPRSKNKELIQNIEERRERYSIRKFSAGAASVLIGISFMGMANSQVVKADTQPASNDENHETKVSAPSTDGVNTSDANAKVVVSVNKNNSRNSEDNQATDNTQSKNASAQPTAEAKTDEAKTNTQTEQNNSTQTFDVRSAGSQGMSEQAVKDQKTADQTLKQNATQNNSDQKETNQKEYDTQPDLSKSITRTVTLNAPKGGSYTDKNGNKTNTTTQTDTINYTRSAQQDSVTKKWTITSDWTADQNHPDGKFAKQEIQTFPGYKPTSQNLKIEEDEGKFYIPETDVEKDADGNLKDSQYSVDFEALQETAKLNFIANDDKKTIVSSQEITGKTGDEVALSLDGAHGSTKINVPKNWKIVPNTTYPTSITIRPNVSADIYVEPATTLTPESVQVTRTITKNIQDKTIGTATQTLSFTRNQVTDPVTGQTTYTDWKSNTVDNNNNPISQYPEIDVSYTGYIPTTDKGSIINKDGKYYLAAANAETDSTGKPIDTNVIVSYTADPNVKFTQVVNYMNGTTKIGSFSISGNAGETVNGVTKQIEDHVPTNYEIVPNTKVISTITFGNENPDPVNVQVQAKQEQLDPNKDPQNQIRQVIRKITIQMPGQTAQDMGTQGVTYYRNATKDEVTGKITYGEWKVATNSETKKPFDQVWAAYNLTQPGYTPTAVDRDNNAAVTLTNENGQVELPQVNVTPHTKSQDILVTYTANSHKYVINYVDNTTKQNVGSQTIEGKTGEKVSYTLQYPNGYKLANVTQNIPAGTISFGSNDPAASTVLVEKDSSTTPDNPGQTYTYTINYANNGQTVGSQDVTGKTGQQVQITLNVPNGYKLANGTQYPTSYTFGNQNASTTVPVEKDSSTPVTPAGDVSQVINYVYNDQTVGSQTLTGKIGTTEDIDWMNTGKGITPKIPEHYTLTKQEITGQFTFHENAKPIIAQVTPKVTTVEWKDHQDDRNYYRTITQTIHFNFPGDAQTITPQVAFARNGEYNEVTKETTYTDWVPATQIFKARDVQAIPGYSLKVTDGSGKEVQLVNGQIPAQTVNADSLDTIYNIDYTAQTLSFKINYVNQANNQTVKSYTISGKPDETVQIDAPVPDNWQVVSGQKIPAGSYKFGNEAPSDMNVLIEPQTISGNQEGQQNNPDLYQKVTETVNITGPNGETQSRDQSLVFYRSQTFDPSTNKWNYSEWQSNMSNKATTFSPVSFTNLDGYTFKVETNDGRTITPVINGNMASIENVSGLVNGTPANVTINVTYVNKNTGKPDNPQADYTYTINYMNGSENVGTQEVTGKAGQQVQITLNIPNGYKLANGAQYPASYTFGNQNASTTVQVVKNDSTTPVNPNNPDTTYTMPVQYLNAADNNAQVGSYTISGKAGQTINVTEDIEKNIPTNYEIVSGSSVPTTITFGNSNLAPALIYVQPKVENVTNDPALTNQTQKTISRQIIYRFSGQADQTTDQSMTFKRLAYKNAVTGAITYGPWSNNGTYTFNAVQLKEQNGFKPDISEIPAWTVTAEGQNDTTPVVVTYTSTTPVNPDNPDQTYTYTINYMNNGQTIDSQKVTGKTGQTVQITLNVPDKYQLVSGQQLPSSVTFGNQDSSTDVQIEPKITTVNGLETKNPDLYRVITRTIQINYPNANQSATVALMALDAEPANTTSSYTNTQSITVYRTQTTNEVTGQKTYTPWQSNSVDSNGKVVTSFEAVALPQITGYKAEIDGKEVTEIPAVSVFDKDGNPISNSNITVVANYVADGTQPTNPDGTHSMVIEYINAQDNKQVGSFTVSGKQGQTIQLTADINKNIPENYEIVPNSNVVSEVTFGNTDSAPALIYVQAKQVNVTDDPSLKDQTEKTISRQIIYKFPGQADQTTDQSMTFKRLAYKNAVTGAITYGPWSNNGTYTFNAIQLKEKNGFKPDISEVPAWTVTAEGQNDTNPVVVTYTSTTPVNPDNPDQTYTYTINYMNNGQNVGSQNITGKAGQQVQITLDVPNGYKLANGAQVPTSYTFGNQNASTDVQVEKDSTTPVDPNQEVKQVINYVYNGQTVGSQTLIGKVGTTEYIDWNNTGKGIKPQLPDHYALVSQQLPESFTFENNAKAIEVQVTGKSVVVNGDEHKDDPNYYRTVTQTINYNYPNQPSQPVVSSRTFVRNATVNEVTGEVVKYSDWSTAPDFIARPVQNIPGYSVQVTNGDGQVVQLVNGQIPAEAVNENSANTVYNVTYTAQTLSFKISYINQANNQVVQSYTVSGKPGESVTINAPIPENWQVVAGQKVPAGSYKFGNEAPSDMNVLIEPQTISGNQQGNQDNPDLYRTVNEVVNITGPNGDTQTRTQNLAFYRSKTFDPSTGNWNYGEWQSNMSNKATTFSSVSFTNLDGYTFKVETSDGRTVTPVINGNTASIENVSGLVNGSPTNITINVAYINKNTGKPDNPESTYTYTINYMNNGQNVGMQNITGKAGQQVQITLNVPKGYKLANGVQVPTSYTFGDQNASTDVQVVQDNGQTPNPDQTYTYTINYLDNGQNVGSQNVTGKSGQTIQITLNIPDGYELANGTSYPTTYTFGTQNGSTNVNVTKKSTNPDNPDQTYSMQIKYINAQDNKQVGSFTVSGKSGQTIQLTQEIQSKIPENYELVPNSKYPTSVTFSNSDQAAALVYVQAKQINVTDDPGLKDQTEKTVSRQIVYKFPGQADQTTDQSITFKRLAYKNAVTGQITYGDWSNDGKYTFSPIQIKQQDGYTASASEIPAWTVTADGQNDTAPVVITFTSTNPDNPDNPDQTYTYTINYVDNGQNVGTQNVTGKSGQTVPITLNVPKGYKVNGQYPTTYTFGNQNASTTVNVVKDTTPDNPGQTISGLDHKDDPSLYREVTQTITVTYPNEQPQSTTNNLIFYRTKTTKDGQTTYSKWTSNSGTADQLVYDFKEQKVTQLPGYTVNVQKDGKTLELVTKDGSSYIPSQAALNANGEPENQAITITYAPENLSVKINYVDNNDHSKIIATQTISGKTGEQVPVTLEVPKNWQVVPNTSVPTSITITPDAKDRTVYIEHKLVTVDGRNDQSNGNLYQKVTRTIVMNYPNQKAGEATSTLEFYRIQTTDEVTGKVTYTDWTSNSVNADKQVISEYPEQNVSLDGYTATSNDVQLITKDGKQYVPATQVARNKENVPISNTIVVNYIGNEQTVEINYVNGNNLIKTQKFSGRTGQTVAVPLELPDGYEIAANVNYPTQITFGANTEKTLTVQVTPLPSGQQKQTIDYVDPNGQVVGSQYVVGTIGQTVDVKASLPINWKLADGASVPSQVTIQSTDTPISVKVVSETVTIDPSKPVTPGTPINSTGQTYPAGLTANDLNKTVTRTVDIVSPDGKTTTTVQKVEFRRDATLSIATGQITYGDWKAQGNKVFNAISVPVIDGYKASGNVDEVEPSADYGNQTLTITYTKVTGQQTDSDKYTPNVVNNGSVSVDVNGDLKPEDVISNKDSLPKGTTIEWSNPDQVAQDLKKAGTYKDVGVKITYPDKSTTVTKVTITVQDKQSSTYTQQIIFVNQKDNKEIKSYTFEGKLTDGHAVLSVDKLKQAIEILFGDITSDAQYKNAKIVESSLPTKDIDITGPTTKPITILVNVEGTSDNGNNSGNNGNTGDNTNPVNPDNPNPVNPDNNNSGNNSNNSNNSNTNNDQNNNGNANNSDNNQSSNNTNNSTNENKPNNGNNSSNLDDNSDDNSEDYDDNDSDDSNETTPKRHKSHASANSHAATGNTGMTVAHANNASWLASHGYVVAVGPDGEVLNYYKASNGKGRIVTITPHDENDLTNSSSSSVQSAGLAGVKNVNETNGNSRNGKLPQTGEKDESALIGLGLIAGAGLLGLAGDRKRKRD